MKAAQSRTRKRIAFARLALARGRTRREVRDMLMDEFSVRATAALKTMQFVDLELEREYKAKRHQRASQQMGKLLHAQQLALNAKKGPDLQALIQIIREQNKLLQLHLPDLDDGEVWAALPMVLRPLEVAPRDSTPTPSNGHSNGRPSGNTPYSRPNGSS